MKASISKSICMRVSSLSLATGKGLTSTIPWILLASSSELRQPSVWALIDASPSWVSKALRRTSHSSSTSGHHIVRTRRKVTAAILTTSSPRDGGYISALSTEISDPRVTTWVRSGSDMVRADLDGLEREASCDPGLRCVSDSASVSIGSPAGWEST